MSEPTESARARILGRVRDANRERPTVEHPGALPTAAEPPIPFQGSERSDPVDAFEERFEAAGGEVVRLADGGAARQWLGAFAAQFPSVAVGVGVPEALRPSLPDAPPAEAALGVSMAVGAAAQTGSLLLTSKEGRRPQLLPPAQIVWVSAADVHATLGEALEACRASGGPAEAPDLPAAIGLHSGPSKSADIGQILVRGVHGPGRIVAAILLP
jgi:L-lactate dehydrogenase complex protein LldG